MHGHIIYRLQDKLVSIGLFSALKTISAPLLHIAKDRHRGYGGLCYRKEVYKELANKSMGTLRGSLLFNPKYLTDYD